MNLESLPFDIVQACDKDKNTHCEREIESWMKLEDEDVGRSFVSWFLLPCERPIKLFLFFLCLMMKNNILSLKFSTWN
jgi:hypothetical protein